MKRNYPATYPKDVFCSHNINDLNTKVCSAIIQYFGSGIANKKDWLQLNTDFSEREDVLDEIEELCEFEEENWISESSSLNFYLFTDAISDSESDCFVLWEEVEDRREPYYPFEDGIVHVLEVSNNPAFLYQKLAGTDTLPQIIADYMGGNTLASISELPNKAFCNAFIQAMLDDNHYQKL